MKLPTIAANLRAGYGVVFCPSCQRILYTFPGFVTRQMRPCPNCKIIELETKISGAFSGRSFDELLYLLAVAALKDIAREDKLLELDEVDPAADRPRGIPDDRPGRRGIPSSSKKRGSTKKGVPRYTARPGRRRAK